MRNSEGTVMGIQGSANALKKYYRSFRWTEQGGIALTVELLYQGARVILISMADTMKRVAAWVARVSLLRFAYHIPTSGMQRGPRDRDRRPGLLVLVTRDDALVHSSQHRFASDGPEMPSSHVLHV